MLTTRLKKILKTKSTFLATSFGKILPHACCVQPIFDCLFVLTATVGKGGHISVKNRCTVCIITLVNGVHKWSSVQSESPSHRACLTRQSHWLLSPLVGLSGHCVHLWGSVSSLLRESPTEAQQRDTDVNVRGEVPCLMGCGTVSVSERSVIWNFLASAIFNKQASSNNKTDLVTPESTVY